MSDETNPTKPKPPRFNHLHAEPVPISFASPQQLAAFSAGSGSLFNNTRMRMPMPTFMPPMNPGFTSMSSTTPRPQTVQPMSPSTPTTPTTTAASASASPKPASSNSTVLQPLPAQPIDTSTFKGLKFMVLDASQKEARDIYEKVSEGRQWRMCEGEDNTCVSEIRDACANKRVFLVATGGLGAQVVPQIHSLAQVYAIYIYCVNVKFHKTWADKYDKVRIVCDNDDRDIIPRLAVDVAQSNIDWGNAFLKQGARDKAKEKFQKAYDGLNDNARHHDPAMDIEIKNKLEECK